MGGLWHCYTQIKVVESEHGMFKFVRRHSQLRGAHGPTHQYPIRAHSMEVQIFTIDRGPITLAMSIVGSI